MRREGVTGLSRNKTLIIIIIVVLLPVCMFWSSGEHFTAAARSNLLSKIISNLQIGDEAEESSLLVLKC